jgi:hypothetical protein
MAKNRDKYALYTLPDDHNIGFDVVYFDRLRLGKEWFNARTTFACTRTLQDTWANKVLSSKHFDADIPG